MSTSRSLKFTEAILDATHFILDTIPSSLVMGLGVTYKNGADGTMGDLKDTFPDRVLDTPISEATTTGAAIGAAMNGMRPILHHGRVEFALFAADQIFTQAAKWNYMFGGNYPVPVVFRIAIGRQWGNGPQHTQALYGLFGSVPGLKVVIPSSPFMAKGLLISAVKDSNPVVFLEPRWLYQLRGQVPVDPYEVDLSKSRVTRLGQEVTIVTYGDGVHIAMQSATSLATYGIEVEVVDLVSINPIDYSSVFNSVKKTGRIVTLDTTNGAFSVGSQIISEVSRVLFQDLKVAPIAISAPDVPVPTALSLSELYYPTRSHVTDELLRMFDLEPIGEKLEFAEIHLPPSDEVAF
jgi:acetoin:2,6-dichlorophenolindophenol oxidoreductase subunit beta